jgi:hypothetical protein
VSINPETLPISFNVGWFWANSPSDLAILAVNHGLNPECDRASAYLLPIPSQQNSRVPLEFVTLIYVFQQGNEGMLGGLTRLL